MPLGTQFGVSSTGLKSCVIRDLDVMAPRPKLPPRALPDDVRSSLGLAPKSGTAAIVSKIAAAAAASAQENKLPRQAPRTSLAPPVKEKPRLMKM